MWVIFTRMLMRPRMMRSGADRGPFFFFRPMKMTPKDWPAWMSVSEVARLLDVPVWSVERYCLSGLIEGARRRDGAWQVPARGLSFFCGRSIEPMYSPETVAQILEITVETVREYLASGRLRKVKLGTAKCSPVRVKDSDLRRWVGV